ncbi:MAG: hypothetical protein AABX04_04565 [Nanoarchaeota archaeon]
MRKSFLWVSLTIFLLLMVGVCAEMVLTPVANQITPRDKAYFNLKITNNNELEQKYQIFSLESQWNVEPFPLKDKVVILKPGESYNVQMVASLLKVLQPGIYYVSVSVEGDRGETFENKMKIYLGSAQPPTYAPLIKPTITVPEKINPPEPVSIKLSLENKNALNLSNLIIRVENEEVPEFNKIVAVALEPLGRKEVEITLTPNKYQQPKTYTLKFNFERYGEAFKTVAQQTEVMTMIPGFTVLEVESDPIFLKYFRRFAVKNEGNVQNTQEVKYPTTFFEGLLTQGDPEIKKEEGQRYLTWSSTLNPGGSTFVYSVTNYRILFYLGLVLVAILVFYLYVRTPLTVKKTAVSSKKDAEGALSEVKVMIEVKNHSKYPVKDVQVLDVIPAYATLHKTAEKEGGMESTHPHKISHVREGTKLSWVLNDLEAKEHRVMVYRLRAKLNILGGLSLPRAAAEFARHKGRKGKAYSGVFHLGEK